MAEGPLEHILCSSDPKSIDAARVVGMSGQPFYSVWEVVLLPLLPLGSDPKERRSAGDRHWLSGGP